MYGADCHISFISEMRADVPGGLEDHAFRIMRIERAVWENRPQIDHKDVQIAAAFAATQADHNGPIRMVSL